MKEALKKYGSYLFSLAGLSVLLGMPLAVFGTTKDWKYNLGLFAPETGVYNNDASPDTLVMWIGKIIGLIIGFLGVLLVLYVIWAGFIWMTAAGDDKKVQKSKDMLKQAVIGIIIVFAAYAITSFVMSNLEIITGA
ncbi:MAG: hypothetical protein WC517_01620 [Patescibacteria group bacterium]